MLRPGGRAVVMVYNRHSFRMLVRELRRRRSAEELRAAYDTNAVGKAAPYTDYVTRAQARALFGRYSSVRVEARNFDGLPLVPRRMLWAMSTVLGLDLYVLAVR